MAGIYDYANRPTQKNEWQDYFKQIGLNYGGNNEAKPVFNQAVGAYAPEAINQAFFSQGLGAKRRSAISQLLDSLSQANQNSQRDRLQRGVQERSVAGARQAGLLNRSMGLSDGFNAGNNAAFLQDAGRQQADIARQYASPEHYLSVLQSYLGGINAGEENPALSAIAQLYPMIFQSQQYNDAQSKQRGLGGVLGQISPILGQYLSGMGGSQGSGGGTSYGQANKQYAGVQNYGGYA